jgi:hypothetical protein
VVLTERGEEWTGNKERQVEQEMNLESSFLANRRTVATKLDIEGAASILSTRDNRAYVATQKHVGANPTTIHIDTGLVF